MITTNKNDFNKIKFGPGMEFSLMGVSKKPIWVDLLAVDFETGECEGSGDLRHELSTVLEIRNK
jgi:hypothetical protein